MNLDLQTPIRDMFDTLVPKYDRFNRVSSLGLDTVWRRELAKVMAQRNYILDVGTGTGKVIAELMKKGRQVVGVDFSDSMIAAAQERYQSEPNVSFSVGKANQLPFAPNTFDGLTSAFVVRNLHHAGVMESSFREFARVLKKGGLMAHLELTKPPKGVLYWGHHLYLRSVVPMIGRLMFRGSWPKGYLSSTIQQFPAPKEMCQRIRWAGFDQVSHYALSGGIASLFCAVKC